MKIDVFESRYLKSKMYILLEDKHAIFIDPCDSYQLPEKTKIDYILLTHEHYDHISGVNYWKEKADAKVVCSRVCGENIRNPKKNLSRYYNVFTDLQTWVKDEESVQVAPYECSADITYEGKMNMMWKGHDILLFESPGHSKGSSCIVVDQKFLFSGDSLMKDYDISCRLPGGSLKDWEKKSKPLFKKLPKDIIVMPGHFDAFYLDGHKEVI